MYFHVKYNIFLVSDRQQFENILDRKIHIVQQIVIVQVLTHVFKVNVVILLSCLQVGLKPLRKSARVT